MKKMCFAFMALSMLAVSCVTEIREPEQMAGNVLSLTASTEQPVNTRTAIAGAGDVLWEKGDDIKVFSGKASGWFVSDVEGFSSEAVFTGSLSGAWTEGSPLWAVYPFSNEAVLDGETLTAELPAVQTAREMTFAQGMNLSVARTTTAFLQFYNVGGGLCFTLKESGIQKVVFEGLNGEVLAGTVKIGWQEDRPVVQEVVEGSTTVTLAAPEGKTLEADGVWYYMVALPGTLEKGFKLSFYKGNTVAQKTFAKTVTVKRSIYGEVRNADEGASYIPDTDENIKFKDTKVKEIVVRYFDTGKDGELSYKEAAAVQSFFVDEALTRADGDKVSVFAGTDIETFDEIIYFTGLTKIEDGAFAGCTQLTSITIPANITEIGANAFKGCTGLQSITIESETPPAIGEGAFADTNDCPIIVPAGTTETYVAAWGEYAPRIEGAQPDNEIWYTTTDGQILNAEYNYATFDFGSTLLSHVYENGKGVMTFDTDVTRIGEYAFMYCTNLSDITLPKTVTSIGTYAFDGCRGIKQVELPKTIMSLGLGVFGDCPDLSSIVVAPGNPVYDSRDNCNAIIHTESNTLVCGCSTTVIPSGIVSIVGSAFEGCQKLSSITIPESVTSIGNAAFASCSSLSEVVIPDNVTSLGPTAFAHCTGLTSVRLSRELKSLEYATFYNCPSLVDIVIPEGVTTIGKEAFNVCKGLVSITLPESLTSIGEKAFYYCESLVSLIVPKNVAEIGTSAFSGAKELTQVTIEGPAVIGKGAFSSCKKMTSLTLSERVVSLGQSAFTSCTGLETIIVLAQTPPHGARFMFNKSTCPIYVPARSVDTYKAAEFWSDYADRIQAIVPETQPNNEIWYTSTDGNLVVPSFANVPEDSAFGGALVVSNSYADGKGKILFDRDVTELYSCFFNCTNLLTISLPQSVTYIGAYTFEGCGNLTGTIEIPKGQTKISNAVFNNCSSLEGVIIPEGVTNIGARAFMQCRSLTELTLPKSLTSISNSIAYGCSALTRIAVLAETPPKGSSSMFTGSNCPIYVPEGSMEAYKTAQYWSDYADRFREIGVEDRVMALETMLAQAWNQFSSYKAQLQEKASAEAAPELYNRAAELEQSWYYMMERLPMITTIDETYAMQAMLEEFMKRLDDFSYLVEQYGKS